MNKLKYIALLLLIVLLLGGCLGQYLYITNLTEQLLTRTAQLTETLRAHDPAEADAALSDFTLLWDKHRSHLYSLVDHQLVNNIENELAALTEDLHNRNSQQLYSESARLTQAIQALAQPEQLTLSNLL